MKKCENVAKISNVRNQFQEKAIIFKRLGLLRIQPVIYSICGVWTMQAMDDRCARSWPWQHCQGHSRATATWRV